MIFTFENPKYLAVLLVIPLLIFVHFYSLKRHTERSLKFANFDAISRISGIQFFSKNITLLYLSVIFVVVLSLASSGLHMNIVKSASSFSFVVAIDSSQSMETEDIVPNRMEAAKSAAKLFVDEAPISTDIGIISFSGVPFIEHEMTSNKAALKSSIDRISISRVGGTNIMNAMIAASSMFSDGDTKAVILITDGQISVDTIEAVIKYANQNEIVINTIGVGSVEGGQNQLGYFSSLDENSLKSMAFETQGNYAIADNSQDLDSAILQDLKITKRRVGVDMTYPLIFLATLIFILIFVLMNLRYQNIP